MAPDGRTTKGQLCAELNRPRLLDEAVAVTRTRPSHPFEPNTMSALNLTTRPSKSNLARRSGAVALTAGLLVAGAAGTVSAKEIGSGSGTGITTTACDPIASLTYKGDARAGETGIATIMVTYDVKPCNKAQSVTVDARLYLTADPSAVAYDDPDAPLSGKFTAFGVKTNTSYLAKITLTDSATGAVVATKSIYAAAVRKGV